MESTLSIRLQDIAEEVGFQLGYDRIAHFWTGWNSAQPYVPLTKASQLGDVMSCIRTGLRRFYAASPTDPVHGAHRWSFLTPERTLATAAGVSDYPLPDDHGGFVGEMTFAPSQNVYTTVVGVGIATVRRNSSYSQGLSSFPTMFAEVPYPTSGVTGQRFGVVFYPTPDQAYTLTYRANLQQNQLAVDSPYPYGGEQHGDTIMAACLAAAELHLGNEAGALERAYIERLRASITVDARDHRPENLGYNGDRSDAQGQWDSWINGGFHPWTNIVTYNGQSFNP